MALWGVLKDSRYQVVPLLTAVTEDYGRVSMHGVRRELVATQAHRLGLPLREVLIPKDSSNDTYETRMGRALEDFRSRGVTGVAFGDIFLEDLKKYRQDKLAQVGLSGLFPIWKQDTRRLAEGFIEAGFKAVITCADTQCLDGRFAGREYDRQLLNDLPSSVDPCGENGEFHSFAYDGPIFSQAVCFSGGQVVLRESRFSFCDLIPPVQ